MRPRQEVRRQPELTPGYLEVAYLPRKKLKSVKYLADRASLANPGITRDQLVAEIEKDMNPKGDPNEYRRIDFGIDILNQLHIAGIPLSTCQSVILRQIIQGQGPKWQYEIIPRN